MIVVELACEDGGGNACEWDAHKPPLRDLLVFTYEPCVNVHLLLFHCRIAQVPHISVHLMNIRFESLTLCLLSFSPVRGYCIRVEKDITPSMKKEDMNYGGSKCSKTNTVHNCEEHAEIDRPISLIRLCIEVEIGVNDT